LTTLSVTQLSLPSSTLIRQLVNCKSTPIWLLSKAYNIYSRGETPEELDSVADKLFKTNVTGNIHFFNLFMPLVLKGKTKKVIAITSGHADLDFINNFDIENSALYSASKAALNIIVAKFSAQYKKDGVLVFSMSPGVVEVGHFSQRTYPHP
jgi:NAD(P)-dependent dehydrogenase (short-subunit alcohol dehydrogenase family)